MVFLKSSLSIVRSLARSTLSKVLHARERIHSYEVRVVEYTCNIDFCGICVRSGINIRIKDSAIICPRFSSNAGEWSRFLGESVAVRPHYG